jgi:hypothetical protein
LNNFSVSVPICELIFVAILHCFLLTRSRKAERGDISNRCTAKILTFFFSQQLAALLIVRQVIGNIKESALPYFLEQFRLAKLSFEMFGALSPSEEAKKDIGDKEKDDSKEAILPNEQSDDTSKEDKEPPQDGANSAEKDGDKKDRALSQAELEGALFKVSIVCILQTGKN